MRVKLFSLAATTPIQSLENDINEFLETERPHVTYVSVSSSDIERVASVWYEEPHHRTVDQTDGGTGGVGGRARRRGQLGVGRARCELHSPSFLHSCVRFRI